MGYKQDSKDISFFSAWTVALVFVAFGVGWAAWRLYVVMYRDVAPRQEASSRQVFVNTPSYVLGKQQMLSKMEDEYRRTKDKAAKAAIRNEALNEASTVDETQLSARTQAFLAEIRSEAQ